MRVNEITIRDFSETSSVHNVFKTVPSGCLNMQPCMHTSVYVCMHESTYA